MFIIKKPYLFFAGILLTCLLTACSPKKTVVPLPNQLVTRDAFFSNSILFPSDVAAHFYWPPSKTLSESIRAVGGEIYQSGSFVTIVLPNDALFEENTSIFLPAAYTLIDNVAKIIVRFPDERVIITAHTDGIGSELYQAKLSRQQAQLVAMTLWQQKGIDLKIFKRFKYAGMANALPITEDPSAYGQALNRRIQITLYPSQAMAEANLNHLLAGHEVGQI